jgi:hypothetical protein
MDKKCIICEDNFITKIEGENRFSNEEYLCLNCMTVFNENGNIIERG